MKHTEGPWKVMCGSVYNETGNGIAHMDRSPENGILPVERDANAHFIVRACNAHYDLIEACRAMVEDLEPDGIKGCTALRMGRNAIAKTEGRE